MNPHTRKSKRRQKLDAMLLPMAGPLDGLTQYGILFTYGLKSGNLSKQVFRRVARRELDIQRKVGRKIQARYTLHLPARKSPNDILGQRGYVGSSVFL